MEARIEDVTGQIVSIRIEGVVPPAPKRVEVSSDSIEPSGAVSWEPTHSEDFSTVDYQGQRYPLTPMQRPIIACLWRAWRSGQPFLATAHLLEIAGSTGNKMADVFRRSLAWQRVIVSGDARGGPAGSYCLAWAASFSEGAESSD